MVLLRPDGGGTGQAGGLITKRTTLSSAFHSSITCSACPVLFCSVLFSVHLLATASPKARVKRAEFDALTCIPLSYQIEPSVHTTPKPPIRHTQKPAVASTIPAYLQLSNLPFLDSDQVHGAPPYPLDGPPGDSCPYVLTFSYSNTCLNSAVAHL